jgi:hypothetical protein
MGAVGYFHAEIGLPVTNLGRLFLCLVFFSPRYPKLSYPLLSQCHQSGKCILICSLSFGATAQRGRFTEVAEQQIRDAVKSVDSGPVLFTPEPLNAFSARCSARKN